MKIWKMAAAVAVACSMIGVAHAAPEINIRELSQSEAAYNAAEAAMSRQLRLATLSAQIAEKEKAATPVGMDIGGLPLSLPALPAPSPASVSVDAAALATATLDLPKPVEPEFPFRLTDLWGSEAEGYQAYISVQGMRKFVRVGDLLPGNWQVLGITQHGLRVQRGRVIKMVAGG